MADEHRLLDARVLEQPREDVERLLVHEARRAGGVREVGLAVTGAGVDQRAAAGGPCQPVREVAPQRDGPEPFVQEHERGLGALELGDLEDHPPVTPLPGTASRRGAASRGAASAAWRRTARSRLRSPFVTRSAYSGAHSAAARSPSARIAASS